MTHGGRREGAGRRPLFKKTTAATFRLPTEVWLQIPEPKAAWIRQVVLEKVKEKNNA